MIFWCQLLVLALTLFVRENFSQIKRYEYILKPLEHVVPCNECPNVYFPVCSTQNVTYLNPCFFFCRRYRNARIIRRGICLHY